MEIKALDKLNEYLLGHETGNKCSRTTLFARAYYEHLLLTGIDLVVNNEYGPDDDYAIFAYDPNAHIYNLINENTFLKNILDYIESLDNSLVFELSYGNLMEIYEYIKLLAPQVEFDTVTHNDEGDLIININCQLFNVNKREFIEWDDKYKKIYPMMYMIDSDRNNDDIIDLFTNYIAEPSVLEAAIEMSDIDEDIASGYTMFDLDDILDAYFEDEYPDFDFDDDCEEDE